MAFKTVKKVRLFVQMSENVNIPMRRIRGNVYKLF